MRGQKLKGLRIVVLAAALSSVAGQAQTRLANQDIIRKVVGTDAYTDNLVLGAVKIAVLDNSFFGFSAKAGLLPASAKLVEGPAAGQSQDGHGLGMAQIAWATAGRTADGPEFILINANGYTNFKAAVDYVIANKIKLVLYAQTWDFYGNFDGKGFLNAQVNRAVNAGVIWINAAGNFGKQVYTGSVDVNQTTGHLRLPGDYDTLRFSNKLDSNNVSVTLAWSDFTEDESDKTMKDLDIFLYDETGSLVETPPNRVQKGEVPTGQYPTDTRSTYAREQFNVTLNRGEYSLKIKDQSGNFVSSDKFRVVVSAVGQPSSIEFTDANAEAEVGVPADNPNVITVGDCSDSSAAGKTVDGRSKPDVVLASSNASFSDGKQTQGSSNAAAMVAGAIAVMMAREPLLDAKSLKDYLKSEGQSRNARRCGRAKTLQWRTPTPTELINLVK